MARSRVMRSVLQNLLGTYASRHSDFQGYWLFGYLIADLGELRIDLLGVVTPAPYSAMEAATNLALTKFREQVSKAGLNFRRIKSASIVLERLATAERGFVNGHVSDGYRLRFAAAATMDTGRTYESESTVFVAPHDPSWEQRSARAVA